MKKLKQPTAAPLWILLRSFCPSHQLISLKSTTQDKKPQPPSLLTPIIVELSLRPNCGRRYRLEMCLCVSACAVWLLQAPTPDWICLSNSFGFFQLLGQFKSNYILPGRFAEFVLPSVGERVSVWPVKLTSAQTRVRLTPDAAFCPWLVFNWLCYLKSAGGDSVLPRLLSVSWLVNAGCFQLHFHSGRTASHREPPSVTPALK